jgi:hypothetical protein
VTKGNKLIGHVNGYTATIDIANDSNIEISWERFWNSNGDSIDISRMWIDTPNNSLGYIWYIFATTANEEQSTILQLEVDENGDLWEQMEGGDGSTCMCKASPLSKLGECKVRNEFGKGCYCTPSSVKGSCTKISALTTGQIFDC